MALTTKLPQKSAPTASTTFSSGIAQRSIICQNTASVNTTYSIKQIDSASDNNGKTNQYYYHGF